MVKSCFDQRLSRQYFHVTGWLRYLMGRVKYHLYRRFYFLTLEFDKGFILVSWSRFVISLDEL